MTEEMLWTGESVWCVNCKHYVTDHQTALVTYSMRNDTTLHYYCKKCPRNGGCHEFRGR